MNTDSNTIRILIWNRTFLSFISFVAVFITDRAFSEFILSMKIRPHNQAARPIGHA